MALVLAVFLLSPAEKGDKNIVFYFIYESAYTLTPTTTLPHGLLINMLCLGTFSTFICREPVISVVLKIGSL